jgi:hypothetical protein
LGTACCCALSHVSSNARLYGETDTSSVASTSLNSKLWRGDENEEDPVVTIAVASNVQRCDFLHSIFVFSKEAQHGVCVTSCPSSERERERERERGGKKNAIHEQDFFSGILRVAA